MARITFASASRAPAAGDRVNVEVRNHRGRYTGSCPRGHRLRPGRNDDGSITGGTTFLDQAWIVDSRRRLLRIHELGHALGYLHMTRRPSIMNPAIGPEPTEFDRAGAIIAFQRSPGNRAPDADPSPTAAFSSGPKSGTRWAPPVF